MSGQITLGKLANAVSPNKTCATFGFWIVLFAFGFLFIPSARSAPPPTIDELLDLPPSQRAVVDPAELSLLCIRDLPGAQDIDAARCLAALEQWTEFVRVETTRRLASLAPHKRATGERLGAVSDRRRKAQALVQGLHDVLGSDRYPASLAGGTLEAAVATGRPLDSQDLFLCGVLGSARPPHRPTSVSLPWLYLAVGRRLGYPLRLAAQDGRLLLRWEGRNEQFTIDWQPSWTEPPVASSELRFRVEEPGRPPFSPASDQPPPVTSSPLRLFTADDELAVLLGARGACLESHGQNREALVAYAQAHRLSPDCDNYLVAIAHVMPRISALFGHTQPVPAPDYSDRDGPLEVDALNRYNLQRQQEDEATSRQITEENRRILKARQDQRSNHP